MSGMMLERAASDSTSFQLSIDLGNPQEVERWAHVFGISEADLVAAARDAGVRVRDIAIHLRIVPNL